MLKIKENKKAEMSSKMLITIILLIIGFGILLIIYSQLNGIQEVDRQACHQSVVLRGTLPDTLSLKELPSLNCKTRKICITNKIFGKGECENLGKEYDTLRISKDKEKAEENIKKIFADELADCWAMMGEGKIQVFEREISYDDYKRKCVICSRINLDGSVKKDVSAVDGFIDYLMKHKLPNTEESYWSFMTKSKEEYENILVSKNERDSLNSEKMYVSEKAILFYEAGRTDLYETVYGSTIGLAVTIGMTRLGTGFGFASKAGIISYVLGSKLGGTISDYLIGEEYYSFISVVDYISEDLKKLNCDSLESIP